MNVLIFDKSLDYVDLVPLHFAMPSTSYQSGLTKVRPRIFKSSYQDQTQSAGTFTQAIADLAHSMHNAISVQIHSFSVSTRGQVDEYRVPSLIPLSPLAEYHCDSTGASLRTLSGKGGRSQALSGCAARHRTRQSLCLSHVILGPRICRIADNHRQERESSRRGEPQSHHIFV